MKKPGNTKLPSTDEEMKALAAKEKGKYTYAVNDYFAKPKSSSFQLSPNGTFMSYREKDENLKIPDNINYDSFSGFSNEVKSKFKQIKPKTMGQALRIDGITPAAVFILLSHLKRKSIKKIA